MNYDQKLSAKCEQYLLKKITKKNIYEWAVNELIRYSMENNAKAIERYKKWIVLHLTMNCQ